MRGKAVMLALHTIKTIKPRNEVRYLNIFTYIADLICLVNSMLSRNLARWFPYLYRCYLYQFYGRISDWVISRDIYTCPWRSWMLPFSTRHPWEWDRGVYSRPIESRGDANLGSPPEPIGPIKTLDFINIIFPQIQIFAIHQKLITFEISIWSLYRRVLGVCYMVIIELS